MKKTLTTLLTVTILITPAVAAAQSEPVQDNKPDFYELVLLDKPETLISQIQIKPVVEPPKPEPVVYSVVAGDNLTKIGTAHNVEWQRLWAKNTQLSHPDHIAAGDKITIPEASEQLSRELPAAVSLPAVTPGVTPSAAPARASKKPQQASARFGGGNTYVYGYCTWYVKNRRGASIPNGLGNANTWYSRAAGLGMAVGSAPRAGAVGTTTSGGLGHVVYVESVNSNGTVNISEMNYKGFGVVSRRTTSASEFRYIY